MHRSGTRVLYSATDVSGFLACPHLTSLENRHVLGGPDHPKFDDPSTEVLRQRGEEHEGEILDGFRAEGLRVERGQERDWGAGPEGWRACADHTLALMREGVDVIHQGVLFDGEWLGLPDFLRRVDNAPSDLGDWSYEVTDAKLARSSKATAVLQVCFYSELLESAQGAAPEHMHLALGGPEAPTETFRVTDYAAYYRSVKGRFLDAVRPGGGHPPVTAETDTGHLPTYPEPCEHCQVCDWAPVCKEQWREDDHLSLVAGITRKQRARLEEREAPTLEALAELPLDLEPPLESVSDAAYTRIREQARIQLEGRREGRPKYELLRDIEENRGLLVLPPPSPGDLFFDIEGDPHAFTDGLEYLLGWVDVDETFTGLWALDPTEERVAFERFIDFVVDRLERWPDLHVYHYNHYETTAVKKLASRYATREDEVDRLLRGGVFVDLYRVVRQGLRASVESYSIKKLEPLYRFDRAQDLRAASSALANFEAWLQLGPRTERAGEGDAEEDGADDLLQEIQDYNEDDCVSTLRLRDWLEERRTELAGILGRELPRPEPPDDDPSEGVAEEGERVQALMDALTDGVSDDPARRSPEEQARWILAHLLSWHRREDKSFWWEYFRLLGLDEHDLLRDSKALAGLEYVGVVDQVKRSLVHRYRFPEQDFKLSAGDGVRDPHTEENPGTVVALDEAARTIDLKRGKDSDVPHPTALIPFEYINDTVLKESLWRLADDVVAHGLEDARNRAAADLLLKHPPRAGQEPGMPLRRTGERALEAGRRLAPLLEGTILPIQGPPGSGKTYIGARMIVTLLAAGKRVGVTATSHKVIGKLLDDVCAVAREEGVEVRGIQKATAKQACADDAVASTNDNKKVGAALTEGDANLAAGTVWLWSRPDMAETVDVLFVDEAGQMSLANVLAASQGADSVVLLGDPQQLEQPQKGVHPPGTGLSALEHLVGERTLSAELGLFLEETWRLHPDVCAFTSELYYEGLLTSRPELAGQEVRGPAPFDGFGLRFVPVAHEGNASESTEEVEAIRELLDELLASGATWVDAEGVEADLRPKDVLVVAPYNAQVGALRAGLSQISDAIAVGTVDKFQGQEAPIVIYSTATSSADEAPRGMDFIYSPNRLNVATSRARCLAVVVGSPALFMPDCRSVKQMRLANGFCRFGEMAGR